MTKSQNKRLRSRRLLSWNSMQSAAQLGQTGLRPGARAGVKFFGFASDAARSPLSVILRRVHLALFVVLTGLVSAPLHGASTATVSGVVRDSAGTPQIATMVQLMRPDMSVVASVYTNRKGYFSFATVLPGHYAVKAMGASFLPSLRENVRVR